MDRLYLNILRYLQYHPESSRSEIMEGIGTDASPASVKRRMADAVAAGDAVVIGAGRATKFKLTEKALLLMHFDIDTYFQKEVDEREIHSSYNFDLISDLLPKVNIFTREEMDTLDAAQQKFRKNISELTDKLNNLVDEVNDLKEKFNSHTHIVNTTGTAAAQSGTAAATTSQAGAATRFNKDDYEDTKITH